MVKAGEKITDPATLERLSKAREKALEVRRARAKQDEKLLNAIETKKRAQEVTQKLSTITETAPSGPEKVKASPVPEKLTSKNLRNLKW